MYMLAQETYFWIFEYDSYIRRQSQQWLEKNENDDVQVATEEKVDNFFRSFIGNRYLKTT